MRVTMNLIQIFADYGGSKTLNLTTVIIIVDDQYYTE